VAAYTISHSAKRGSPSVAGGLAQIASQWWSKTASTFIVNPRYAEANTTVYELCQLVLEQMRERLALYMIMIPAGQLIALP
jgi:hypothetical protein